MSGESKTSSNIRPDALAEVALVYELKHLAHDYLAILRLKQTLLALASLSPDVFPVKLSWWQTQILTDEPQHPALRALDPNLDRAMLGEFLIESEARNAGEQAQSAEESRLRLLRIHATAWQMLANKHLPAASIESKSDISKFALAAGMTETARRGCGPGILCPDWLDADLAPAAQILATEATNTIAECNNRVTGVRSLDILARLVTFDCARILDNRKLAPLRQVWIAWRTARQLDYSQ